MFSRFNYLASSIAIALTFTSPQGIAAQDLITNNAQRQSTNVTTKWDFDFQFINASSRATVTTDGSVYLIAKDDDNAYLYALDANGNLQWQYQQANISFSDPVVAADGTIYLTTEDDNRLLAINPDGSEKWQKTFTNSLYISPTIATDNRIYIVESQTSDTTDTIHALDDNGESVWSTTHASSTRRISIAENGELFISSSSAITALNNDGTQKWTTNVEGYNPSELVLNKNGSIYYKSTLTYSRDQIVALDSDGNLQWTWGSYGKLNVPIIGSNNDIYITLNYEFMQQTILVAIAPDGDEHWAYLSLIHI